MNINDFVVLPKNKAQSVKLNARSLQEMNIKSATLTEECKEMEVKLQELKERMRKEKEERGLLSNSAEFIWKSGQCGPLNSNAPTNSTKQSKENILEKLLSGKVKLRVLKDGTQTVPHRPPPPPPASALQMTRKSRLKVLAENQGEEEKVDMTEEGLKREDERGFSTNLLIKGEYDEEESMRSFQEALRQWRGGGSEDTMWKHGGSVSETTTQAGPAPDRPVRVEFSESTLTYMDRLHLKKHRRNPIEMFRPSSAFATGLNSLPNKKTEEETASSLTAEEEDYHHYVASLFAVPVSSGRTESEITTPESCLTIEVLDERDEDFDAEQRTDNNRKTPSVQNVFSKRRTPVPQTAFTSGGSSRVSHTSPSPTSTSRQSTGLAQPKAAQRRKLSNPQTSESGPSTNSSSSKSKSSSCPTAETPRTSKTLIKTPTSMSQKPNCSPGVYKSKADHGSPRFLFSPSMAQSQTEIPKSLHTPVSFLPDVAPLASARQTIPEEHLTPSGSISLRSTFTISPSGSSESILLPRVYQSSQFRKRSDPSLLPEQHQSSQIVPGPISSLRLSQSSPSNLEPTKQSQHSLFDPESFLSEDQLQPPLAQGSSASNLSSTLFFDDQESALSLQSQSPPSLSVTDTGYTEMKMEEEGELIDSGDELSSDSLGLAPHDDDSSDEGHSARGRSTEEERENPAIRTGSENNFQTDEREQLSQSFMVMHKQSAGSGSEHFSDLDGFLPLGLDVNCGHSDTPEHTHWDSQHTSQTTSPYDSGPKGSQCHWPSSALSSSAEEHLVFTVMKDEHTEPSRIQIHSTTPTRSGGISANEPGASGSNCSTQILPRPNLGSQVGPAFRPLSRVAQEIMEICDVDKTGCEDPDLETDANVHTLCELEQELRLMTEAAKQASVTGTENSRSQDQQGNQHFTWGRVSEEQKEEEEAAQRDRQSVLLLP